MTAQEYILNKDLIDENDSDIVGILWYDENIEPVDKINIFRTFYCTPEYAICMELKWHLMKCQQQLEIFYGKNTKTIF